MNENIDFSKITKIVYNNTEKNLKYEKEYWKWATLRKQFTQDIKDRKYYRKNGDATRRKYTEMVVTDYPELELSSRIIILSLLIIPLNLLPTWQKVIFPYYRTFPFNHSIKTNTL